MSIRLYCSVIFSFLEAVGVHVRVNAAGFSPLRASQLCRTTINVSRILRDVGSGLQGLGTWDLS